MITQEPEITRRKLCTNYPWDSEILSIEPGDGTRYTVMVVPFYPQESGSVNLQALGSVEDGGFLVVDCMHGHVAVFSQDRNYLATGYVHEKFHIRNMYSLYWLTWLIARALDRKSNVDNMSVEEFLGEESSGVEA